MERQIQQSLRELKEQLVEMGGLVERAIDSAVLAMRSRDQARVKEVHQIETQVNRAHKDVDQACLKLLALQQPMAADLRLILAVIKINTDLERMADQAENIAFNSEKIARGDAFQVPADLVKIGDCVRAMVRESLNSFVLRDEARARAVLARDDEVDDLKDKIFQDTLARLRLRPDELEQGLSLILIARNLERIGDHATNIAEDVIFAVSAEDIRHSTRPATEGSPL